jgi:hypothetical protein
MLSKDIIESIRTNADNNSEVELIIQLCMKIKSLELNVGNDQLIRAALVVTKFTSSKLEILIKTGFNGDPRDLLVEANKMKPTINYGINQFENKS